MPLPGYLHPHMHAHACLLRPARVKQCHRCWPWALCRLLLRCTAVDAQGWASCPSSAAAPAAASSSPTCLRMVPKRRCWTLFQHPSSTCSVPWKHPISTKSYTDPIAKVLNQRNANASKIKHGDDNFEQLNISIRNIN